MRKEAINGLRTILGDTSIRSITAYLPPFGRSKRRILITRHRNDSSQFSLRTGRLNYQEEQHLRSCKKKKKVAPRLWIRYFKRRRWMFKG
jgi:hypothetical protein